MDVPVPAKEHRPSEYLLQMWADQRAYAAREASNRIGLGLAILGLCIAGFGAAWLVVAYAVPWQIAAGCLGATGVSVGVLFEVIEFEPVANPARRHIGPIDLDEG